MVGPRLAHAPTDPSIRSAPVAEFLSDAWIGELDRAARAAPGLPSLRSDPPLVVEQRVRDGQHEVVYAMRFSADGVHVAEGPADAPDLVVRTDAATALALQRGATSAQDAASSGRLKVRGRVEGLWALGEALRTLDDVFREVRDATTKPTHGGA